MMKIKPVNIPSTENHLNGINGSIPSRKEEENDGFSHYRKVKASLVENSIINYPGASTQALCSAPTSPLTALAFRSCSRKRESGVCEFVCLCFYI